MSDLIAISYPDVKRAGEVIDEMKPMIEEHLLDLDDAVYVTKEVTGKVQVHQTLHLPGVGAAVGGGWGMLWGTLVGAVLLNPILGLAVGAAIGAGSGAVAGKADEESLIDSKFVKQVATNFKPNTSALFVLVRRATTDKVVAGLSKYGGTLVQTSLSNADEAKLQAALTQGAAAAQRPAAQQQPTSSTSANP
jgi:uncharacterized membrane protein